MYVSQADEGVKPSMIMSHLPLFLNFKSYLQYSKVKLILRNLSVMNKIYETYVPTGFHTVTTYLFVENPEELIDFLK